MDNEPLNKSEVESLQDVMERARQAQQTHMQRHDVQLEIPDSVGELLASIEGSSWATEEEARREFHARTLPPYLTDCDPGDEHFDR